MAYSSVGVPRFYLSWGDWWKTVGGEIPKWNTINPQDTINLKIEAGADWYKIIQPYTYAPKYVTNEGINWVGILNHNLTSEFRFIFKQYLDSSNSQEALNFEDIINVTNQFSPDLSGFSIATLNTPFDPLPSDLDQAASGISNYEQASIQMGIGTNDMQTPNNLEQDATFQLGCFLFGKYFDMPSAPDMKLSMSVEMDGIKKYKTKGGKDLVDYKYIKPASWGNHSAWELWLNESSATNVYNCDPPYDLWLSINDFYNPSVVDSWCDNVEIQGYTSDYYGQDPINNNEPFPYNYGVLCPHIYGLCGGGVEQHKQLQQLSRIGRRVWDLSWSFIDETELGVNTMLIDTITMTPTLAPSLFDTNYESYNSEGLEWMQNNLSFRDTVLTENTFFAQVIMHTNGGQIPFIFNPNGGGDNPNNNIDQFAICKLDMSKFSFIQQTPTSYSVKLRIKEVW